MRLLNALSGFGLGLVTTGAAFAQDAPFVSRAVDKAMGFQPAASNMAREVHDLDHMILIIITVICLFVTAMLLFVIFRFNQKSNPKPATFTHNSPLEIAWTLIPIIILVAIGSFSLPVLFKQAEIPTADLTIKVTGNQWYWSYEYLVSEDPANNPAFDSFLVDASYTIDDMAAGWDKANQPMGPAQVMSDIAVKKLEYFGYTKDDFLLATDNAVVLPVNKNVVIQLTGADVIHAWMVPSLGVQMSAVPGRLAEFWFNADKEGTYFGQCTTLCGKDHAYMPITVKVVSEAAYAEWLAKKMPAVASNETVAPVKVAAAD